MIIKCADNKDSLTKVRQFLFDNKWLSKEIIINDDVYFCLNEEVNLEKLDSNVCSVASRNDAYYFVSRKYQKEDTIINVHDKLIGGNYLTIIGGPCSVESAEQIKQIVSYLKKTKTDFLRAGIFKPRTSPYTFQGLGKDGLTILKEQSDYPIVCELTSIIQVNDYAKDIDIIQIGARNMQNFELLKAVAQTKKPIILKRGFNATIKEWLLAAEYLYLEGNPNIILCERGIRSFETSYRNVTDINAIVYLKKQTHLPIIIDPSHSTGLASMVESVALGCLMAGANGMIVETHYKPSLALSDGNQSLNEKQYCSLVEKAIKLKQFMNNL